MKLSVVWRARHVARVCAAVWLIGLGACGERAPKPSPAEPVFPAVTLTSLGGTAVALPEALRGKAVVVNFWATWCEPCRKEMPSLERLHRLADTTKIAVIGISVDTDLNLAREFLLQYGVTFANYSDSAQSLARSTLGVRAIPATFLVAADGAVRAQIAGLRDWSSAETLGFIQQTLAQQPPPAASPPDTPQPIKIFPK